MTKIFLFALSIVACGVACGCGGNVTHGDNTGYPRNQYFNASMIGQVWIFQNDDASCTTTFRVNLPPPSNYYPDGSIVLNISKNGANCYWAYGTDQASIDFVLSPLPDGSFNSKGWVAYFPGPIPDWAPSHIYAQQVQATQGHSTPYIIVPPPSLAADSSIVTETSYDRWDFSGQNFNSFVSGPPVANVYWKTVFFMRNGKAISKQREGICGAEEWTFEANRGLIAVEFPNDGAPSCIALPSSTNIHRVL